MNAGWILEELEESIMEGWTDMDDWIYMIGWINDGGMNGYWWLNELMYEEWIDELMMEEWIDIND